MRLRWGRRREGERREEGGNEALQKKRVVTQRLFKKYLPSTTLGGEVDVADVQGEPDTVTAHPSWQTGRRTRAMAETGAAGVLGKHGLSSRFFCHFASDRSLSSEQRE